METDILIVGGGVGGAALAAAIAASGLSADVLVVEQASHLGGINRGDLLQPAQIALLHDWGVLPLMEQVGALEVPQAEYWHPRHGRVLTFPYAALGGTYPHAVGLPHPRITAALLQRAAANKRAEIWQGATFLGLQRQRAEKMTATLQLAGGSPATVHSRWIVAADGRYSLVRQATGLQPPPRPGRRFLLAAELDVPPAWASRHSVWLHPAGFVALYPLSGEQARIVLSVNRRLVNSLVMEPPRQLLQLLLTRAPELQGVSLTASPIQTLPQTSYHAPAYVLNRTILLGDAAHSFPPALGLGMNAAIADAAALAALLADGDHRLQPERLRRQYESLRRPANSTARQASDNVARLVYSFGGSGHLARRLRRILHQVHGRSA